jgi:hypothetical protein
MVRVFTGVMARIEADLKSLLRFYQPPYLRGEWYELPDSCIDRVRAVDIFIKGRPLIDDECREMARQIVVALTDGAAGIFIPPSPRGPLMPSRLPVVSPAVAIGDDLTLRGVSGEKPTASRRRKNGGKGNPKGRVLRLAEYDAEHGRYTVLRNGRISLLSETAQQVSE